MTNYKSAYRTSGALVQINTNGNIVQMKDSVKLVTFIHTMAGTSISTLHDPETGANYVVPSGKKLTVIYITTIHVGATRSITYSDDVDGSTNEVTIWTPAGSGSQTNLHVQLTPVPAGKYINYDADTSSVINITCIEEDA